MTILDTSTGNTLTETDWLATRRTALGASDCAAALGVSQFATPIEKWQEKIGKAPPIIENEAMRWGKLLEPVIQAEYERRENVSLATQLFVRHPEFPWMVATLDGIRPDGRIVEFKTAGSFAREWGDEDSDEVPLPYLIQTHHQMLVSGADAADLAVLIGGQQFRIYRIARDAELCQRVLEGARRFWRCVETRTPPDWGRMDAAALAVLHPNCAGTITLDGAMQVAVDEYETIDKDIAVLETAREAIKTNILAAMGDNQFGVLPDGRKVKRFREEHPEKQVSYVAKAYTKHYIRVMKGAK